MYVMWMDGSVRSSDGVCGVQVSETIHPHLTFPCAITCKALSLSISLSLCALCLSVAWLM